MRLIKFSLTFVALVFLQLTNALFAETKDAGPAKTLSAFFEAEWNYEMEQSPARASSMGDRRWNDRWGDQSLEAIRKRQEHAKETLANLGKFDRAKLPPADQLNYDLFKKDLETDIEGLFLGHRISRWMPSRRIRW